MGAFATAPGGTAFRLGGIGRLRARLVPDARRYQGGALNWIGVCAHRGIDRFAWMRSDYLRSRLASRRITDFGD